MEKYLTHENVHDRYVHIVEYDMMYGHFKGTVVRVVSGNVSGFSTMEHDFEDFEPNMIFEKNQKHIITDKEGYMNEVVLFSDDGSVKQILNYEEMSDFVVSVRIAEVLTHEEWNSRVEESKN